MSLGVSRMDLLRRLHDHLDQAPQEIGELVGDFLQETRNELWGSEQELIAHYQDEEQYGRLLQGEVGGNLIYKYKTLGLGLTVEPWLSYLTATARQLLDEKLADATAAERVSAEGQLNSLAEFCRNKLAGLLDPDSDLAPRLMSTDYDVVGWLHGDESVPLGDYARSEPVDYEFLYTAEQVASRKRMFDRYGTEPSALSKIVTRIPSLESWIRKVKTVDGEGEIYSETDEDRFTRYTLAR